MVIYLWCCFAGLFVVVNSRNFIKLRFIKYGLFMVLCDTIEQHWSTILEIQFSPKIMFLLLGYANISIKTSSVSNGVQSRQNRCITVLKINETFRIYLILLILNSIRNKTVFFDIASSHYVIVIKKRIPWTKNSLPQFGKTDTKTFPTGLLFSCSRLLFLLSN